jgi:hypothetical protein
LRPTSAFTIDDLPTLGRPTTATSPLRWPISTSVYEPVA